MKQVKKGILSLMTVLCCLLMPAIHVLGAEENRKANIGVSYEIPYVPNEFIDSEMRPYGTVMPDIYSIYENNVEHSIYGTAAHSTLYTDSCFYGVNKISKKITNNIADTLTVKLRFQRFIGTSLAYTESIPGYAYRSSWWLDLEPEKYYYIEFSAPSNFSGTIEGIE